MTTATGPVAPYASARAVVPRTCATAAARPCALTPSTVSNCPANEPIGSVLADRRRAHRERLAEARDDCVGVVELRIDRDHDCGRHR